MCNKIRDFQLFIYWNQIEISINSIAVKLNDKMCIIVSNVEHHLRSKHIVLQKKTFRGIQCLINSSVLR